MIFQSTLPAGEATKDEARQAADKMISIHASRGGSDKIGPTAHITNIQFQSTLPAGEATTVKVIFKDKHIISIHASRGGSDNLCSKVFQRAIVNFNPRFPRGKRQNAG